MFFKRFLIGVLSISIAAPTVFAQSAPASSKKKPNVVFILADNVGYGDMGPYGGGELRGAPTPRTDQLAREGLTFTQFLVENACTPSRAALMTGQYSIRNGLSLVALPSGPNTLPGSAYTMGKMFKDSGYATAMYGKWHLGEAPQSVPGAHGFDQFYGIPPSTSWVDAVTVPIIKMTHSVNLPEKALLDKGPWIVQSKGNGPLERVKPFTPEVRAEIDNELTEKSISFMKKESATGKPFFLYLPFSMGHAPNYPSKEFAGKSRIGQYGDKIMEGDYHVGQILDALKEMNIDNNTIVIFASDNGPWRFPVSGFGNLGSPDMGFAGPFRGEIGQSTEGSIRTFAFIRWPGHVAPNTRTNAMFSIMDWMPTLASAIGAKMPTDRPIDGVDQTALILGKSKEGNREALLTFIGPDLTAVRWKQWRFYFKDEGQTGTDFQKLEGTYANSSPMYFPKVYNIEMDPHEDLNLGGYDSELAAFAFPTIMAFVKSTKQYPIPPAPNTTNFRFGKSD